MKKQTNCRLCGSDDMFTFLNLGYHPHSDQFRKTNDEPETRYPLWVQSCRSCGLAQLGQVVDAHELYTKDYLYEASITKTADQHWEKLADDVMTYVNKGVSVDIGGNDGTLALKFKERGFDAYNIDPCKEVCEISEARGVKTINDFWLGQKEADVITGTNVFAHVDDLDLFVGNIKKCLKGVFVFESPYFADFIEGLEYDTVYHQHLSYLSLKPLIPFFEKHGLRVFDVKRTLLHGGGFRVFIDKGIREVSPRVQEMINQENWKESDLIKWGEKVKAHGEAVFDLVYNLHKQGKTIACVSSPAKGMTLLNYTGIGKYISYVTEKSKLKIGRYTPGTKLKIVGDEELDTDYAIVLAWNFSEEIIRNNPNYKGKWIILLPMIEVR